jgi:hypothetical protein
MEKRLQKKQEPGSGIVIDRDSDINDTSLDVLDVDSLGGPETSI